MDILIVFHNLLVKLTINIGKQPLDRRKCGKKMKLQIFSFILFYLCWLPCCSQAQIPHESNTSCPPPCTCVQSERLVNCSNRSLRQIPKAIPSWVAVLTFRNNKITTNEIQSDIFNKLPHLKELDFSDNRLNEVNLTLRDVPMLRILRFDHCSLHNIPTIDASTGRNITTLSLSHNSIVDIGHSLKWWISLQQLDLSFNKISQLRNRAFDHQSRLSELYLHKNKIKNNMEEQAFFGLHSLQTLTLARNKIRELRNLAHSGIDNSNQHCMGDLHNLEYLDLSRNHIAAVKGLTFQGMCRLQTLLLNDNAISKLHDGAFFSLKNLTTLKLDNNLIGVVEEEWLFDLESLRTLSLSRNNVSRIKPVGWKYCERIQHLNLSYNDVDKLSAGMFARLSQLRILDLNHNRIDVLQDNVFKGSASLHTLDLSHNRISSSVEDINGAFNGLSSLAILMLNNNRIRSLSADVLRGVEGLHELNLQHNDITSVENGTFNAFTVLQRLYIDSSSFLCDCQLSWFAEWLHLRQHDVITSHIEANCFHPPELKGRDVSRVNPHQLKCGEHPIPALLQQPSVLTSYKGENVTLECSASATLSSGQDDDNVDMSVVWRKGPDRLVVVESRLVRIRNQQRHEGGHVFFTSLLLLYNVAYGDDNMYSCVISNGFGHAMSDPARLKVFALPRITNKPDNATVKYGSEVILDCQATGHPLPEVSWMKVDGRFVAADEFRLVVGGDSPNVDDENHEIINNGKNNVNDLGKPRGGLDAREVPHKTKTKIMDTTRKSPLHITEVKAEDAGEYKCTAESEVGVKYAVATLTVLYPPILEAMPSEVKTVYGGNAVLKCMAHAHPPPHVTWYMNNNILKRTARHFLAADGQLLVIVDASSHDGGLYTCVVTNDLGTKRKEISLVLVNHLDNDSDNTGGLWDALLGTPGIVVAVLVCILATSLVWLILLCYTRKHHEEAYSTNTESSDLPQVDSSSHDSLDKPIYSHSVQSPVNLRTTQSRPDISVRCYDAPDLLLPSSCRSNRSHQGTFHPNQFRSFPRNYSSRVDRAPRHMRADMHQHRLLVYDRINARPPIRAASTSHVYNMYVDNPSKHNSAHSILDTQGCKAGSGQHRATKRRRRRKREVDDARESTGGSSKRTYTSSSDSDATNERQQLVHCRLQLTPRRLSSSANAAKTREKTCDSRTDTLLQDVPKEGISPQTSTDHVTHNASSSNAQTASFRFKCDKNPQQRDDDVTCKPESNSNGVISEVGL